MGKIGGFNWDGKIGIITRLGGLSEFSVFWSINNCVQEIIISSQ